MSLALASSLVSSTPPLQISIVSERESRYLDRVSPRSGKAKDIASEILDLLSKKSVDTKQIVAIGCDSTAVNTGMNRGVVRLLEKSFKKSINWFICLLYINELPLRHLFSYLDGPTTGPRAFSGTIGKALQTCDKNPVVRCEPIEAREPLRSIAVDDLSTDQKYLYAVCLAVTSGQFHDDLVQCFSTFFQPRNTWCIQKILRNIKRNFKQNLSQWFSTGPATKLSARVTRRGFYRRLFINSNLYFC